MGGDTAPVGELVSGHSGAQVTRPTRSLYPVTTSTTPAQVDTLDNMPEEPGLRKVPLGCRLAKFRIVKLYALKESLNCSKEDKDNHLFSQVSSEGVLTEKQIIILIFSVQYPEIQKSGKVWLSVPWLTSPSKMEETRMLKRETIKTGNNKKCLELPILTIRTILTPRYPNTPQNGRSI